MNAFRDKSRKWTLSTGTSNGIGQKFLGPIAAQGQRAIDKHQISSC